MSESAYDEIAEWYDAWVGPAIGEDDPFFPTVEALLGGAGLAVYARLLREPEGRERSPQAYLFARR